MKFRVLMMAGLLVAIGCAERAATSPFTSLSKQPLQPGVGLGTLKLQETTLGAFSRQYGLGQSVVTPDQTGAKIDFLKFGMAFLFRGDPACADKLSAAGQGDINNFLLQNPDCETMLLETIAAYVPASGEPVYEGETLEGVGLNAAREMAERAYRKTVEAVNALEMGTPLPEEPLAGPDEIRYPGIRVYLGKDASGREVVRRLEVVPRQ